MTVLHEGSVWDLFSLALSPLSSTELCEAGAPPMWLALWDYFCSLAFAQVWQLGVTNMDWDKLLCSRLSFLYFLFLQDNLASLSFGTSMFWLCYFVMAALTLKPLT